MAIKNLLLYNTNATGGGVSLPAGRYSFALVGTFGGATVTLQMLGPDGVTWLPVGSATALTAAGRELVEIPSGTYRALVASGAPSGLYASLDWVGH